MQAGTIELARLRLSHASWHNRARTIELFTFTAWQGDCNLTSFSKILDSMDCFVGRKRPSLVAVKRQLAQDRLSQQRLRRENADAMAKLPLAVRVLLIRNAAH